MAKGSYRALWDWRENCGAIYKRRDRLSVFGWTWHHLSGIILNKDSRYIHWPLWTGDADLASHGWLRPAKRRHYVARFIVTSFSWRTFIYWKNNNTCLMGDAILRIPRDARVRAYSTRDTYDGVVPVTSKMQPYCHSSYIELSGYIHTIYTYRYHHSSCY